MHYIPVNVLDNGCVWGTRIKTRNLIEAGVIALGVFLIMSIVIRYLSLLLEIIFRRQRYLVSDVEIIQK